MEKIKALIEQLGGSKELCDQIVEALENFKTTEKTKLVEEYNQKLEKAKEVCQEEVEDYKQKLARKVQVFFESRVEKIESQIAKQVAIKDSAAESKLQQIASLLEGIEVNSDGKNAEAKAAIEKLSTVAEQNKKLESQNRVLVEKVKRAHSIAEKALERNAVMAKELAEAKNTQPAIAEKKEDKKVEKPIAEDRKVGDPTTTRKTDASQLATKGKKEESVTPHKTLNAFSPESIAESIE